MAYGETYEEFVEKFKQKKTTDDCYTPPNVYNAVLEWAVAEYSLKGRPVARPFYPGGDYEHYDYPENCVVIDNPPFSIGSKICKWYTAHGIDFFLFAPTLTLFSGEYPDKKYVVADCRITYENGAIVNTSFVTNLGEYKIMTAPDLYEKLKAANQKNVKTGKKELPKYRYPKNVIRAALLKNLSLRGQALKIRTDECTFVRELDCQKAERKHIFGGGFLISDRAAAERAAAEREAADRAAEKEVIVGELSEREREIIRNLG